MTLENFRVHFEKGRKDQYDPKPADVTYPPVLHTKLSPQDAEEKVRASISEQVTVLENVRSERVTLLLTQMCKVVLTLMC